MKQVSMIRSLFLLTALLTVSARAWAFCGFYVARADVTLFNKTSQVILVRNGDKNVVTMSSDFQGDVRDFAMVVPVPNVLKRDDIRVVNASLFTMFDAYSAPRMASYYDQNPCHQLLYDDLSTGVESLKMSAARPMSGAGRMDDKDYNVKIEAQYSVGEYDILILSAEESGGLERWLNDNGYKIPAGAAEVLHPYIKSNMKFFVVKVNLNKVQPGSSQQLNPLQISYKSPKFMLPIRLGMANSNGNQDLVVYALTSSGRVECTNYRTVKIPTNRDIPVFVQNQFGQFYKDCFDRSYKRSDRKSVFLEYSWDLSVTQPVKCDPCNGPPPVNQELLDAGVFWLNPTNAGGVNGSVWFTRLHVRYNRTNFPQDLMFQETPNRENFQGRYVIHYPAYGSYECEEGQTYLRDLVRRRKGELDEMYYLAGWSPSKHWNYVSEFENLLPKESPEEDEDSGNGMFIPEVQPEETDCVPVDIGEAGAAEEEDTILTAEAGLDASTWMKITMGMSLALFAGLGIWRRVRG